MAGYFFFRQDKKTQSADVRPGMGIAFRLSLWILLFAALIFALVLGYYYHLSRQVLVEKIEQYAGELSKGTAARIDTVLAASQKIPHNLAALMAGPDYRDPKKVFALMENIVADNPEIYGTAVAFAPYAWDGKTRQYSPYVYRQDKGLASTLITYDYFSWDWYLLPAQKNRSVWVEPYFDEGAGNIIMSTYSVPFYRGSGKAKVFFGVVTVDISLEWLQQIVSEIQLQTDGYAFLVSQNGTFVTHPDKRLIMDKTIFDLAMDLDDTHLRELGMKMTMGETGVYESHDILTGEPCWLAFAPLSTTGWSLGIVFARDDLMADVSRHYRLTLLFGALGLMILFGVIIWIAHGITAPLRALTAATRNLAQGDLDMQLPAVRREDEVGRLASSFASMRESLKRHIRDLTAATAARERIESELKIAHDIQMGILPRIFPPFPEREEIDIFALLKPAREVGGDLYDFFFLDEDHLCFSLGDVSGKGVPAALFMAVTKILIKSKAAHGLSAETIVSRVNFDLAQDNPSMMFVTLFLGILNLRTGELAYCNGGHPPPYVLRADGKVEPLPSTGGMALGVVDDFDYRAASVSLNAKDTLFLFSDGITEAVDARCALFGETRLEAALSDLLNQPLSGILEGVLVLIEAFAQNEPQADDITMMAVRYHGRHDQL